MKIFTMMLMACALSAIASAQVPDFTPQTPLIGALLHNDRSAAKQLLESGADPNEGQFFGMPPVLLAILRQDLDLVRLLTAKGADLSRSFRFDSPDVGGIQRDRRCLDRRGVTQTRR